MKDRFDRQRLDHLLSPHSGELRSYAFQNAAYLRFSALSAGIIANTAVLTE